MQFVWAPNFGQGYPFPGNLFPPPDAGSDDFKALDTNHDGVVSPRYFVLSLIIFAFIG